ncbi:carboxymuconolactone decarboxylase family protein [Rouxiella silvae]
MLSGWKKSQINNTTANCKGIVMRLHALTLCSLALLLSGCVHNASNNQPVPSSPSLAELGEASPALAHYTQKYVDDDLWKRTQLSPRDRSIVTLAALIARNDRVELPYHLNLALDNGVKPGEISEIVAHLAFYSGWPSATSAAEITRSVFAQRGITQSQLPPVNVTLLGVDEKAETARSTQVASSFNSVSSGTVEFTEKAVFGDLWRRPGLTPRDRSMVTVSALITSGQVEQIGYHLNRAMDNGLTQRQASEMLTQLAFYAGWPKVFSALPVAKKAFEARNS